MTIRQRVKILPGGTIEIHDSQLPDGAEAEVLITVEGSEEDPDYDDSARPIWEEVLEIGASVPPEEWAKVPADLSINFHHYLYGAPKEEE